MGANSTGSEGASSTRFSHSVVAALATEKSVMLLLSVITLVCHLTILFEVVLERPWKLQIFGGFFFRRFPARPGRSAGFPLAGASLSTAI